MDSALERTVCAFENAGTLLREQELSGADVFVKLALAEDSPSEEADEKAEPGPLAKNNLPIPKEVTVQEAADEGV